MNKKAKARILQALVDEFQLSHREQYYTKKSILMYSKKLNYSEERILAKLRESKKYAQNWINLMNDPEKREEIIRAEQSGLLCGKPN